MTLEPRDYLQPDEAIVLEARPRMASMLPGTFAGALLVAGLTAVLLFVTERWWTRAPGWIVPLALGLLAALWAGSTVAAVVRVKTGRFVVTDTRLYRSHGRIRFQLVQTTYDKMTDIHVVQGPFGRWRGYGSLTANTAGAALVLHGLPRPFDVKQRLEEARSAFLRRLVASERRKPAAGTAASTGPAGAAVQSPGAGPAAPTPGGHGQVVWNGAPSYQSMLGRLASAGVMLLAGGVFLGLALSGLTGTWFGSILLLVGLGSGVSAVIAYKYSRYEVTAAGVVVTTGWLSRRRVETTFAKVTDVTTTQTLLGRLMGYGDIRINTAGSNDVAVAFTGVARPQEVKAIIDQARGARP